MEKEIEKEFEKIVSNQYTSFKFEKIFYEKYKTHPLISLYFKHLNIEDFYSIYTKRHKLYNILIKQKIYDI